MSLIDLLRMSSGNLKRRKLRTFLTVLGVVIGTASIVVMISLGLGLQQSTYKEIEKSGGLTTIQVTGKDRQGDIGSGFCLQQRERADLHPVGVAYARCRKDGTGETVVASCR